MVEEIEAFFEYHNKLAGKECRPVRRSEAGDAMTLARRAVEDFERR